MRKREFGRRAGMKTGALAPCITRQRTRPASHSFPQPGRFEAAHRRATRPPLSAISGRLSKSPPQDRQQACRLLVMRMQMRPAASMPPIIFRGVKGQRSGHYATRTTSAVGHRGEAGPSAFAMTTETLTRSGSPLRAQSSGSSSGHFWAPCRTRRIRIVLADTA